MRLDPKAHPWTTLVTGLPRSGTSLAMQMLEAGGFPVLCDEARKPDADNPRGYFEYAPVKASARDASWVEPARAHAVKVIHALLASLPADRPYRVLVMRRDLRQVIASQDAMLKRSGAASDDPLPRARLEEVLRRHLDEALQAFAARADAHWLDVSHAEALSDPTAVARAIDGFLGGSLDLEAMVSCVDPTLHRKR